MSNNRACLWKDLEDFISNDRMLTVSSTTATPSSKSVSTYRDMETYVSPMARLMQQRISSSAKDDDEYSTNVDQFEINESLDPTREEVRKDCIEEIDKLFGISKYSINDLLHLKSSIRMKVAEIIEQKSDKSGNNNSMNTSSFIFPGEEESSNTPEVRKKNSLDNWRAQKKQKKNNH